MSRFRPRRSFGGLSSTPRDPTKQWEPKVDKNPFYRTMDIFNGVFKKNIKLSAGPTNATDMHTIFINFGESKPSKLKSVVKVSEDGEHTTFMLECGHEWEGKTLHVDKQTKATRQKIIGQDWGMCFTCGADQIYRGFEHEWQHIIFKSDLAARKIFVEQYADQLLKQAPHVDRSELTGFLHLLVNAFDDIRVNSLWEKVYPGSAYAIWDRWRWFSLRMGDDVNKSFLAFIFAVAFNLPTDPQGDFAPMRPVVEWATKKVKYRGFANMLVDVKVVLDRCMGTLLAGAPPPPPPQPQPPPPQPGQQPQQPNQPSNAGAGFQQGKPQNSQQGDQNGQDQAQGDNQPQPGDPQGQDEAGNGAQAASGSEEGAPDQEVESQGGAEGEEQDGGQQEVRGGDGASGGSGINHFPTTKSAQADDDQRSQALQRLMKDPKVLDEKEEHQDPSPEDLDAANKSQAVKAMIAKVLNQDIDNVDALDQMMPTGQVDKDMQAQLDQLKNSVAVKSESSQLTSNAKARVTVIDVTTDGKSDGHSVELDSDERFAVQRMRSAFFRTMGRQKAKRSPQGNVVDVQSLIQYLGDHQDPNVFENEDVNQGFAYSVLCDMSGSMVGTYPQVTHAVEMLKQALHFPFVIGNLWGFRGGESIAGRTDSGGGEVWMYRYARDVNWYTGTTPYRVHPGFNGIAQVPVKCGGITPMNSAINVASAHLWRKMPAGMAKRMFLLTDGSPVQVKVSGQQLPDHLLRQFVAKEIIAARKHGIQVYTIIIGQHAIEEDHCLQMFGPRKFWSRVGTDRVGTVLAKMVLSNFSKYIRARG